MAAAIDSQSVMVTQADTHDAVAAKEILLRLRLMHPQIAVVWADSIYGGTLVDWAKSFLNLTVKTVSGPEGRRSSLRGRPPDRLRVVHADPIRLCCPVDQVRECPGT
ncbi:transposase [Streptomyces sporangiiformans]|uniref:Transposase n=1 Tax=Streptomyces sporangiiformans TaxID=2315329 RepID=A0A505D554_9ACTN|nr:transposase [Streptomyces sporangiiformans]